MNSGRHSMWKTSRYRPYFSLGVFLHWIWGQKGLLKRERQSNAVKDNWSRCTVGQRWPYRWSYTGAVLHFTSAHWFIKAGDQLRPSHSQLLHEHVGIKTLSALRTETIACGREKKKYRPLALLHLHLCTSFSGWLWLSFFFFAHFFLYCNRIV